jgi:predicted MFS family arabinose efflux permease
MNAPDAVSASEATVTRSIAAASLGLVWLGDAFIYVVLPVYPAAFGVDAAAVAVLLSVNRVIRIIGYGWVSPLAQRLGANTLTAGACAAAALSTLCFATGFVALMIARTVWGCAFGVLNLTNTAYAYGDGKNAGKHLGLNRAISTLGQVAALVSGGWLVAAVGPQNTFVAFGLVGLLAVPLAWQLPSLQKSVDDGKSRAERRWTIGPLNMLFFVVALGADGVFTATLSVLLADIVPVSSALIGAGLLIAGQRIAAVVLALMSGVIVDRIQPARLIIPCSLVIAAAMAFIGIGSVYIGAILLIPVRAIFAIVGSVVAAQKSTDRIGAIAAYTTWTDVGLAAGAFVGIVAMESVGAHATYLTLALVTVLAIIWFRVREGANLSPSAAV